MYLRIKPEELVHKTSKLDTTYFSSVVNKSKGIQDTLKRRADKVIGADIFQALYDWEPVLRTDGPDSALTAWVKQTSGTKAFKELRESTVGSREIAAGATVAMYRELMRSRESKLKDIAQTKHSLDSLNTIADGTMSDMVRENVKQIQDTLADSIADGPAADLGNLNGSQLSQLLVEPNHVAAAIGKATELVAMAGELAAFDSQGGNDAHVLGMIDSQLMQRVTENDTLRKIFQIAGRMKVVLQQAKSKKPRTAPTPVSLAYGADLGNLVSSELAALGTPETEDLFYQKYIEKGLLVYEHKARVNEGLGPFICLLDVSGSMHGAKEETAKALFVSLAKMGIEKKRKIVLIAFASHAGTAQVVDSSSMLLRVLSDRRSLGSGTLFDEPLTKASELIASEKQYKQADVLLITDGHSRLQDSWIEQYMVEKDRLGFRLYGVNVAGGEFAYNQRQMFDATVKVEDGRLGKLEWFEDLADRMVR